MARQETVLSVFVASPTDVVDERARLEEVIHELNVAWARSLGIRLELIRWETHASPGFGSTPQAVINEQLPDDFDLFIGIMWYRFGTPTEHTGSGTVEEFERAKSRFDADNTSVRLMIYFKEEPAPIPPTELDPKQLERVSNFRSTLGKIGGLYWTFRGIDDFERQVRLHLTRYIQSRQSQTDTKEVSEVAPPAAVEELETRVIEDEPAADEPEEGELGILDLAEYVEDEFSSLVDISKRIADATEEVGTKISQRTDEIGEFAKSSNSKDRNTAKRIIERAAADMDHYVHRMESELPLFNQHLTSGMKFLTKAAALSLDFMVDDTQGEQLRRNKESIRDFRQTMTTVEGQLTEFQAAVSGLPRMTVALNRSKRNMARVIEQLIEEFRSAQRMAEETETSFESIASVDG